MLNPELRDSTLFHGDNRAGWESEPSDIREAKYWTSNPGLAFQHAINNAIKFKSEPMVVVHLKPDGAKFEDATIGDGMSGRDYTSRTRFDENGDELEIYPVGALEEFLIKYLPDKTGQAHLYLEHIQKLLKSSD